MPANEGVIRLKRLIWFLIGIVVAFFLITWLSYGKAEAVETCPATGDWIKVEPLSGKTYTYSPAPGCTVSDNCYKHSTYVHYGTGVTVTADSHCTKWEWWGCDRWTQYDLSHASFKVDCVAPTPTPTNTPVPTVTNTPIPTATSTPEPTPTDEPTPTEVQPTPTDEVRPTPTDVEPTKEITPTPEKHETCEGKGNDENGHPCGWSPEPYRSPEYKPTVCSVSVPLKPTLKYGRKSNTVVELTWNENDTNTTHWAISYGLTKDNLIYGIPFLPKESRRIDINGLNSKNWWFQLIRYNTGDCAVRSDVVDP